MGLAFGAGGMERSPGFSVRGAPHLCAPRCAPGPPPLFLPGCPVLSSPAPCVGGSWEPGSSAGRERGISRAAAAAGNRGLCPQTSPSFQGGRRRTRPRAAPESRGCDSRCRVASARTPPRGDPSSAKEPLLTRIVIRIKTLFFCFVSQNVSSKECKTLQTNLAFLAFSFAGCY